MTEISEAAMAKAREVLRAADPRGPVPIGTTRLATWITDCVAELIQQVSDAAKEALAAQYNGAVAISDVNKLAPFILPDPVDPLVDEAFDAIIAAKLEEEAWASLERTLARRGLEIREIGE